MGEQSVLIKRVVYRNFSTKRETHTEIERRAETVSERKISKGCRREHMYSTYNVNYYFLYLRKHRT